MSLTENDILALQDVSQKLGGVVSSIQSVLGGVVAEKPQSCPLKISAVQNILTEAFGRGLIISEGEDRFPCRNQRGEITMTITRIKFEGQTIKAFEGRKKVAEVNLTEESESIFDNVVEQLEGEFENDGWEQEGDQWKDVNGDAPIRMGADQFGKYIQELVDVAIEELGEEAGSDSEEGEEEEEDGKKGLNIPEKYRAIYGPGQNCGDEIVNAMDAAGVTDEIKGRRHLDMDKLYAIAAENGITPKGTNNGHIKMNVANLLRGKLRRGEEITILGKVVFPAKPVLVKQSDKVVVEPASPRRQGKTAAAKKAKSK